MNVFQLYLKQTYDCLDAGLYYPALAMALAIPDMCAGLQGINGTSSQRYKSWLESVPMVLAVEPEWVWRVRCSFLHDASPTLGKAPNVRGLIIVREPPRGPVHRTTGAPEPGTFGTITVEIDELVNSILQAASCWALRNHDLLAEKIAAGELLVIQPARQ